MKNINTTILAACVLAMLSCKNSDTKAVDTAVAPADSAAALSTAVAEAPQMDSATVAKAWENYMTPGDMHKWLATMDGKWEGESVSWPAPDAPPTPASKVKSENKMVLGGRYQESLYQGDMMGMPFEGRSFMAYDNVKKVFINTWIDNMGTGIMVLQGPYDETSKSITLSGKMTDPATGKDMEIRQVLTNPDNKTSVMVMYCKQGDREYKNMEIKMVKK